jgi:hypothetical protein
LLAYQFELEVRNHVDDIQSGGLRGFVAYIDGSGQSSAHGSCKGNERVFSHNDDVVERCSRMRLWNIAQKVMRG